MKVVGIVEKKIVKCLKEGGKKGVEIEGVVDMFGFMCFCMWMIEVGDLVELFEVFMEGMNVILDLVNEEERKGCSGYISKFIIGYND